LRFVWHDIDRRTPKNLVASFISRLCFMGPQLLTKSQNQSVLCVQSGFEC